VDYSLDSINWKWTRGVRRKRPCEIKALGFRDGRRRLGPPVAVAGWRPNRGKKLRDGMWRSGSLLNRQVCLKKTREDFSGTLIKGFGALCKINGDLGRLWFNGIGARAEAAEGWGAMKKIELPGHEGNGTWHREVLFTVWEE